MNSGARESLSCRRSLLRARLRSAISSERTRMKTFNLFNGDTDEVPPGAPGHPGRAARVGSKLGAERLGMSVYEIPPGEAIGLYHFEWTDEEWLIVLDGQPTIRTPEGERVLEPGEATCFLAGPEGLHQVRNATDAPSGSRSSPRTTSSASSSTRKSRRSGLGGARALRARPAQGRRVGSQDRANTPSASPQSPRPDVRLRPGLLVQTHSARSRRQVVVSRSLLRSPPPEPCA